jgi:exopolysaccharide biosynthesis polyprenyl glycosylphosphotransferase
MVQLMSLPDPLLSDLHIADNAGVPLQGGQTMFRQHGGEQALEFTPFLKGRDALTRVMGRTRVSPYKLGLLVSDVLAAFVAFAFGAWVVGLNSVLKTSAIHVFSFALLPLIAISFFQTYNLYNYHLIFFSRNHVLNLIKSLAWGLLTLSIVAFVLLYPHFLEATGVILFIFAAAIFILLVSRFLGDHLLNVIKAAGVSFLAIGLIDLLNAGETPVFIGHWHAILIGFCLTAAIIFVSRVVLVHVVFNDWLRRRFRRQVAIVGSDEEAKRITKHIVDYNAPFWVSGFVAPEAAVGMEMPANKYRLGGLNELPEIVEQSGIDEIIVTDETIDKRVLISLLDYCTSEGLSVWFPPQLLPIIDLKLYIDNFCGLPMIRLGSQRNTFIFNKIKHALDALLVLPALIMLLPVFLVIGLAIKLNSRGPVFFKTKMMGKNGKPFTMFKFRSMKTDTSEEPHKDYVSKLINGHIHENSGNGGVFKLTEDHRITPVGRLLRKLSIDELPQLINVLKGEMSLVGPRPCLPYEYEMYKDWHKKRLSVRPGISGVWQVAGRSAVAFEDMVLLDLYYIYNKSLSLDVSILYETAFVVLERRGAY